MKSLNIQSIRRAALLLSFIVYLVDKFCCICCRLLAILNCLMTINCWNIKWGARIKFWLLIWDWHLNYTHSVSHYMCYAWNLLLFFFIYGLLFYEFAFCLGPEGILLKPWVWTPIRLSSCLLSCPTFGPSLLWMLCPPTEDPGIIKLSANWNDPSPPDAVADCPEKPRA